MSIPTDLMKWLEALPMKHWEDRADWFRIACIMKYEGGTIQEFVRLSRRVKRYEQEPMYRYQKVWDSIKEHKTTRATRATLCYWVKQHDEGLFKRLRKETKHVHKVDFNKKETKHVHKVDFNKTYGDEDFVDEIIARYGDNFVQVLDHAKTPRLYHFDEGKWTFHNTREVVKQYLKQVCRDWAKLYLYEWEVFCGDVDASELNDEEKRLNTHFEKSFVTFTKYAVFKQ